MSSIQGGNLKGISANSLCRTQDQELVKIIGFVNEKFISENAEDLRISFDKDTSEIAICTSLKDDTISYHQFNTLEPENE